jgi:spore germination protein
MRLGLRLTLVRAGLAAAVLSTMLTHAQARTDKPLAWAYMAWWMPDSWRSAPVQKLDRVLFFELKVRGSGKITDRNGWPEQWSEFRAAMKQRGTPVDLTLTLFELQEMNALFRSADARARLLKEAVALASHRDVSGLQLDFEVYDPVPDATLEGLRQFVRELAAALHRLSPARHVSVFLPIGGASTLYDKTTLQQVDNVVLQGYDSHWRGGPMAGPLSPLRGAEAVTWEKALAKGDELLVPRRKMMFSFPLYGYEWPVRDAKAGGQTAGVGTEVSYTPLPPGLVPAIGASVRERVGKYGAHRDERSGSVYYQYKNAQGGLREGWFEDDWSLARKTDFMTRESMAGMAFFVLGYDADELIGKYMRTVEAADARSEDQKEQKNTAR